MPEGPFDKVISPVFASPHANLRALQGQQTTSSPFPIRLHVILSPTLTTRPSDLLPALPKSLPSALGKTWSLPWLSVLAGAAQPLSAGRANEKDAGPSAKWGIRCKLVAAHALWVEDFNHQSHWAHREKDARRSPPEVLRWVSGGRYREEDLERVFFSTRFSRVLDTLGYATCWRWMVYGEEGLAGREATLRLRSRSLNLEYAGEPLSRYDASTCPAPRSHGRS